MRAVVQRVARAEVRVDGEIVGRIDRGLCVLVGVGQGDAEADAAWLAQKLLALRIFEDGEGKMNLSLAQAGGALLLISQFTLLGDARQGARPGFSEAMAPEPAEALYRRLVRLCREGGAPVEEGRFRADMQVELVNDGPVTLLLDSKKLF
jgi:D-tyrosyl-tRNA(Tyr) deacylase